MTNIEKENEAFANNIDIISEIKAHMFLLFKISEEELLKTPKRYVEELFQSIAKNNYELIKLRKKRKEKLQEINSLSTQIPGQFIGFGQGQNTGGRDNKELLKQMTILELKDELNSIIIDIMKTEKKLNDSNNLIRKFIDLIPQNQYKAAIEMKYIDGLRPVDIEEELSYSTSFTRKARQRAIIFLSNLLKKSIELERCHVVSRTNYGNIVV